MATLRPDSAGRFDRLLGLDLLRLLAIVMVLGRHMEQPPADLSPFVQGRLRRAGTSRRLGRRSVLRAQRLFGLRAAVRGISRSTANLSVKRFYLRRGWKIYPAFYFLLAFTFCLPLAGRRRQDARPAVLHRAVLHSELSAGLLEPHLDARRRRALLHPAAAAAVVARASQPRSGQSVPRDAVPGRRRLCVVVLGGADGELRGADRVLLLHARLAHAPADRRARSSASRLATSTTSTTNGSSARCGPGAMR